MARVRWTLRTDPCGVVEVVHYCRGRSTSMVHSDECVTCRASMPDELRKTRNFMALSGTFKKRFLDLRTRNSQSVENLL